MPNLKNSSFLQDYEFNSGSMAVVTVNGQQLFIAGTYLGELERIPFTLQHSLRD
jgi:hypothetical protein